MVHRFIHTLEYTPYIPFSKTLLSISLTLALFCASTPAYALFFDVSPDHPYADAIDFLTREGVVTGYENRSFRPENAINRAEFTKILMSVLYPEVYIDDCIENLPESEDLVVPQFAFPDVAHSAWFAKSICAAWSNGIVSGYPNGRFHPEEGVNFVEAAKMLSLGFGLTGIELPNLGRDNVLWYTPYVEFLAAQRAIPVSIEALDQPINRGEMAEMIYRLKDLPLMPEPIKVKGKSAEQVIYPVDWKEYRDHDYNLVFEYSNVWPEPHVLPRGSYDGRSPYIASEWTAYFGPKVTEDCMGEGSCIKRDMWIDGYRVEDSSAILDAVENDLYFIELEEETIINRMPALILLEEVDKCIDKRAFLFGKSWVYALNVKCAGQDDKLYNLFDQLVQTIKEIEGKVPEHRN
ncbi:S-layer homology domain-containing protein [Candidatus Peregrinibacteria bacterium]|nr:S-layer homology domain-containing protein [Candidatus Peribacter sp.]MBT5237083.1 S-layer homology domain-containing protein [Candidatus Peregrinibacteria bacterium]MBT5468201.1 S-layer homology domain-containing protein [Candidatus Peregrinibacteria bacterium]MBT7337648.1 S-layer homology domain-containing protein [Candidatus Peregrinibacteria bacterium]